MILPHFSSPHVQQFRQSLPYCADPIVLYQKYGAHKTNTLLLESAEIESKQNLKSWLLTQAALKITYQEDKVTLQALTPNGEAAIKQLLPIFMAQNTQLTHTAQSLVVQYASPSEQLDEDHRLQARSALDALRTIQRHFSQENAPSSSVFLGGLLAYDLVAHFEPLPKVPKTDQCPDFVFYLAEHLIELDHQTQTATRLFNQFDGQTPLEPEAMAHQAAERQTTSLEITESLNDEAFNAIVKQLKQNVIQGDVFQIVPSRTFQLPCPNPLQAYAQLKQDNPSPYMFYLQDDAFTLFGASPESALKYTQATRQVEIYPIAGTRPRGKNADGSINLDLDGRIELDLRQDEKENAEHMMLVDLARNDVARIAETNTRYVADLLKVDRYSHVMHLVSRVVGTLKPELDALHAYQACLNMGTLTGAPKVRAMQLIRDVEGKTRGSYGGAVGYFNAHGDLDTCIVIRSAYVENGMAKVQAGAGVVFDSDPQSESNETRQKAQAVLQAIKMAHQATEI